MADNEPFVEREHRVPDFMWDDVVKAADRFREESDESETD